MIQTEANVGSFNVDILAEDSNGRKIVIKNQLEATNHDNLGKIITYASGYNAEIIIWIVKDVRNQHKQAIGCKLTLFSFKRPELPRPYFLWLI